MIILGRVSTLTRGLAQLINYSEDKDTCIPGNVHFRLGCVAPPR